MRWKKWKHCDKIFSETEYMNYEDYLLICSTNTTIIKTFKRNVLLFLNSIWLKSTFSNFLFTYVVSFYMVQENFESKVYLKYNILMIEFWQFIGILFYTYDPCHTRYVFWYQSKVTYPLQQKDSSMQIQTSKF